MTSVVTRDGRVQKLEPILVRSPRERLANLAELPQDPEQVSDLGLGQTSDKPYAPWKPNQRPYASKDGGKHAPRKQSVVRIGRRPKGQGWSDDNPSRPRWELECRALLPGRVVRILQSAVS